MRLRPAPEVSGSGGSQGGLMLCHSGLYPGISPMCPSLSGDRGRRGGGGGPRRLKAGRPWSSCAPPAPCRPMRCRPVRCRPEPCRAVEVVSPVRPPDGDRGPESLAPAAAVVVVVVRAGGASARASGASSAAAGPPPRDSSLRPPPHRCSVARVSAARTTSMRRRCSRRSSSAMPPVATRSFSPRARAAMNSAESDWHAPRPPVGNLVLASCGCESTSPTASSTPGSASDGATSSAVGGDGRSGVPPAPHLVGHEGQDRGQERWRVSRARRRAATAEAAATSPWPP